MLAGRYGNYARFEIEKKFLLTEMPVDLPETYIEISDTYLPKSSLRLRIKKSAEGKIISRNLTKKEYTPEKGKEYNVMTSLSLSEDDLNSLGSIDGFKITKRRYCFDFPNKRIAIDQFLGRLEGLILAEVEFNGENSLYEFKKPDPKWREVTGDKNFSCGYLASNPEFNPLT